ncbi:unnamed protein product, partial [Effrenium voratum]
MAAPPRPPTPVPARARPLAARPAVPDSDEDDSSDSDPGGFLNIVKGIQAQTRKGEKDAQEPKESKSKAKTKAIKKDQAFELEKDRKEAAKRTLELMEARRMVEVAMEGEDSKKKKSRKRNIVNKRCSVHLIRQKMDEELAAQERGPRYVNNVAVFVKKGQKDIDANEAEVLVKKDEKEKAKKAKEKEEKKK